MALFKRTLKRIFSSPNYTQHLNKYRNEEEGYIESLVTKELITDTDRSVIAHLLSHGENQFNLSHAGNGCTVVMTIHSPARTVFVWISRSKAKESFLDINEYFWSLRFNLYALDVSSVPRYVTDILYFPLQYTEPTNDSKSVCYLLIFTFTITSVVIKQEIALIRQVEIRTLDQVFHDMITDEQKQELRIHKLIDSAVILEAYIIHYILLATGAGGMSEGGTLRNTIIDAGITVTETAAESSATIGIETVATTLGNAAAGVAVSMILDVALTTGMLVRAKAQRDSGKITDKQFKTTVKTKLCESGCQFVAATTGTIVGQVLIPVPVVGAMVGGFFGSLIGTGISKGIIYTSEKIHKPSEQPLAIESQPLAIESQPLAIEPQPQIETPAAGQMEIVPKRGRVGKFNLRNLKMRSTEF